MAERAPKILNLPIGLKARGERRCRGAGAAWSGEVAGGHGGDG